MGKLVDVEKALDKLKGNSSTTEAEPIRNIYLARVIELSGIKSRSSIEESIFNQGLATEKKQQIAAHLLRFLCLNPENFWEWGGVNRNKAFDLIEQNLSDVWRSREITKEDKGHIKLSKLEGTEKNILKQFRRIEDLIINPKTALGQRNPFMQALMKPANNQFLGVFLHEKLIAKERFNDFFDLLEKYVRSSDTTRLDLFSRIEEAFAKYEEDAVISPSSMTVVCLLNPIKKICKVLRQDLSEQGIIHPADLVISAGKRKYPFYENGRELDLKLEVVNKGEGYAYEVIIEAVANSDSIEIAEKEISLPDIEPSEIEIFLKVKTTGLHSDNHFVDITLRWRNYDSTSEKIEERLILHSQREDLDWVSLAGQRPYSLEAIDSEEELIGRKQLVNDLYNTLTSREIESFIIWGQKRVGKTSIALALQSKLRKEEKYCVVYTLTNSLDKRFADDFVTQLGEEITEQLLSSSLMSDMDLKEPEFKGALAPLKKLLRNVQKIGIKVIIIIDEFDELPDDLVKYSGANDTFFGNLRDLSTLSHVGFVLVGGENMRDIQERSSGGKLNKFASISVDYFNKEQAWQDYCDLVQRPVKDSVEYSDEAFQELYNLTEGNPFFTNILCKNLYQLVCETRDAFVSRNDVLKALDRTIHSSYSSGITLDLQNMTHFWADGISYSEKAERDEIETQRRMFLVAFADTMRQDNRVTDDLVRKNAYFESEVSLERMIESFKARSILIYSSGSYKLRPRLLEKWLLERGGHQMTTRFNDGDAVRALYQKRERDFVKETEILKVIEKWGTYKGQRYEVAHVRAWLDQFGDFHEQRLMFKLLQHLRFFDISLVREALRAIQSRVKTQRKIMEGERSRRDIIISAFGGIAKSGPSMARLYAQENRIVREHVVELDKIRGLLEKESRIKALVFVDDIIGSGKQLASAFSEFRNELSSFLVDRDVKVYVTAICGLEEGINLLEKEMNRADFKTEPYIVEQFSKADQCFSEESEIYDSPKEVEEAQKIALFYGDKVKRGQAMGFENSQLLVTFSDNCPNNTLPIFWSRSNWYPLFERS